MAPKTARIEVFRPGTFTPMEGASLTYSAADLKAVADAYDPDTAPAPVVVGHPAIDAPAYAWADKFDFDATAGRLYATIGEIDPAFAEAVRAGRYKKVSLSFHRPDSSANPVPGTWYPRHIGFLGGAAPAVAGLKNVRFAADPDAVTFAADFGFGLGEEVGGILRGIRDFIIEKFGLETADKVIPAYRIDWLGEMEADPAPNPGFTAPPQKEDPPVSDPDPAFAEREADVARREAAVRAREREIAHADNASFAEGLVTEGKLLPASKDRVVALLDALPGDESVSFADGAKATPGATLREILSAQPKAVSFGQLDLPKDAATEAETASFAADGKEVDPAGLETHRKALDYQRAHPGTDYIAAVKAVS